MLPHFPQVLCYCSYDFCLILYSHYMQSPPPPPIHSRFLPVAILLALDGNNTQLYSAHRLCTSAVSLTNIPRPSFQESDFSFSYRRQYLLFVSLFLKAMYVVWRWILGAQVQMSSSMYPLQLQVLSPISQEVQ